MSYIDQNDKNVGLGLVQGTTDTVIPWECDPATQKMLIEIIPVGSFPSFSYSGQIPIDANTHNVGAGVSTSDGKTIIPLTIGFVQGFPLVVADVTEV